MDKEQKNCLILAIICLAVSITAFIIAVKFKVSDMQGALVIAGAAFLFAVVCAGIKVLLDRSTPTVRWEPVEDD